MSVAKFACVQVKNAKMQQVIPSILGQPNSNQVLENKRLEIIRCISVTTPIFDPVATLFEFLRTSADSLFKSLHSARRQANGFAWFNWNSNFILNVVIPYFEICSFEKICYQQQPGIFTLRTRNRAAVMDAFASGIYSTNMRDPLRRGFFETDPDAWALELIWHKSKPNISTDDIDKLVCNPFGVTKNLLYASAQVEMGANLPVGRISKTSLACLVHDFRLNTGSVVGMTKAMFIDVDEQHPFEIVLSLNSSKRYSSSLLGKVEMFFHVVGREYVRVGSSNEVNRVALF